MAENTAAAKTTATPCECSLFDALDTEQLTEENLANGDYDTFTTGCNATTKRTFAPGHDAKLKSFFIKHDALGHEIRRVDGGWRLSADVMDHASRYDFAHLVAAGIEKATAKAQARAARAAAKAAKPAKAERKLAEGAGLAAPTHEGNEARQDREAKSLAERVAAEEAKHAAELVASRPVPEWDDAAPEGLAEVARIQDSVGLRRGQVGGPDRRARGHREGRPVGVQGCREGRHLLLPRQGRAHPQGDHRLHGDPHGLIPLAPPT
jgi:hypothetical protein